MGKTIRMYLSSDSSEGLVTLELSNRTIKATIFPRPLLKDFYALDESSRPGVYILHGVSSEENDKSRLYIGEGDPVSERLKTHEIKKEFWTEAFVFTSKDEYLTKTQIKFIESKLIDCMKEANRVEWDNVQSSSVPTISRSDRDEAQEFLDTVYLLIQALRLNFFEKLSLAPTAPKPDEDVFEYRIKTAVGKMAIRDGKYVLLSGSTVIKEDRKSSTTTMQEHKEKLITDGALVQDDEHEELLKVVRDIPYSSSSSAATIVCGGHAAGPKEWKINGRSLKEIEDAY